MSRLERERWKFAEDRWPALQRIISEQFSQPMFEPIDRLPKIFAAYSESAPIAEQKDVATECADFVRYFAGRDDDVYLMIDGFGAKVPSRGQIYDGGSSAGTRRIKLLYGAVVEFIRRTERNWKP